MKVRAKTEAKFVSWIGSRINECNCVDWVSIIEKSHRDVRDVVARVESSIKFWERDKKHLMVAKQSIMIDDFCFDSLSRCWETVACNPVREMSGNI